MLVASLSLVVAGGAVAQDVPTYETLSQSQQAAVERGEPVQVLIRLETSPWPRSIVFQFVGATPEQCAAVLSDYELQSSYIPRMRSSRIVARHGENETDVEYVIDIPVFPDERSTSRQRVIVDKGAYRIEWHTVTSAGQPEGSVTTGRATFTPMTNERSKRQGTLMVHDQSVIPSSVFASVPFVRSRAVDASREAAQSIARQIEHERAANPDLLARQLTRLRSALAARPDSGKVIPRPQPEQ